MANSASVKTRTRLAAVAFLVLVTAGAAWRLRKPEANDQAIVDAVYDELVPNYAQRVELCGLRDRINGVFTISTHDDAVWVTGWKEGPGTTLTDEQRTCMLAALKPMPPARVAKHRVPSGREYEVDVSFSAQSRGAY